ncbi:membrane protein DedA, SNARE-associated domain [Abditibacterium utsteinense]|uniref:Membrane protein DedA, SNARE-associated domain n=1 Tax=Abditibacterium utsteinense TaxID=1960156 RepID=A0A2S8SPW3_9BACT|nr:DedA family protein [Abditibacterium utsteinense]PQV62809.1 membrane protein DedA, SNARE-associated domain [Abditibacterium utsteinense]
MLDWITHLMNSLGYPAIVFLMFLENFFPSELVMPLAGFTVKLGHLSLLGVIVAGTFGAVLNALPPFFLSRAVGEKRLRAWVDKHGKWLTLSGKDIDRAEGWFLRHGGWAVFFCRMIPGLRYLISIPAGLGEMKLAPFLGTSALGVGLWSGILAYVGYLLGENYQKVHRYLGPVAYLVLAALVTGFIVRVAGQNRQGDKSWTPKV